MSSAHSDSDGDGASDHVHLRAQTAAINLDRRMACENERILSRAGVPIPDSVRFAEKKPPCPVGPLVDSVRLSTNMWFLQQQRKTIYKYHVEFRGIHELADGRRQLVHFTRRSADDTVILDRKEKVLAIFNGLTTRHHNFFVHPVLCDIQNTVYTTNKLRFGQQVTAQHPRTPDEFTFDDITEDDVDPMGLGLFRENFVRFEVTFKRARGLFHLELGNLGRVIAGNSSFTDNSLLQFLDIATAHHARMHSRDYIVCSSGKIFFTVPLAYGFSPEDILVSDGRNQLDPSDQAYLTIGLKKSTHLVCGPRDVGACVLVLEAKKSPFHTYGPLLSAVEAFLAPHSLEEVPTNRQLLDRLTIHFQGRYVVTGANDQCDPVNGRSFIQVLGFVPSTSDTQFVTDRDGVRMTFWDYYRVHRNYTIDRHDAPLVNVREHNRTTLYPIELLQLTANQRVNLAKAHPSLVHRAIKACAMEPPELFASNQKCLEALNLENPVLQALGIHARGPIQVKGSIHATPMLQYASEEIAVQHGQWRPTTTAKYCKPAALRNWAAVYVGGRYDPFSMRELEQFARVFTEAATQKGMNVEPPQLDSVPATELDFKRKMAELASKGVEYILFAHTNTDNIIHGLMKWGETRYGFITQDNKLRTCQAVIRGAAPLLQNIVDKANVKLGGLNYTFNRNNTAAAEVLDDVLYVGTSTSLPCTRVASEGGARRRGGRAEGRGRPSVVGFSANCNPDPLEFVGDFIFQEAQRDVTITVVATIVERCLRQFHELHKRMPRRVVLFRNGCSEYRFASMLKYEVPLVEHMMEELAESLNAPTAKLTLIVPTEKHGVRFFRNPIPFGRAHEQNVLPGTAIDHSVTSMNTREFYMCAHATNQGTANVPRYTVLHDRNDFSSEQLQRSVYWLCHGHQVAAHTTSLPAPVQVANEYAKRGRTIYKSVTTVGDDITHGPAGGALYERMPPEELNEALAYWTSLGGLRMDFRVNA